jgi:hypothetical protein
MLRIAAQPLSEKTLPATDFSLQLPMPDLSTDVNHPIDHASLSCHCSSGKWNFYT